MDIFLPETWSLYFHDPDDANWALDSYQCMGNISTVAEWKGADLAAADLWQKGMFYLMREYIKPQWEDQNNMGGGCLSFKVNKPEAGAFWFKLCAMAIGETLTKDPNVTEKVCGVSISPKRHYTIMRLWVAKSDLQSIDKFNLVVPEYTQVIYKSHHENDDYCTKKK